MWILIYRGFHPILHRWHAISTSQILGPWSWKLYDLCSAVSVGKRLLGHTWHHTLDKIKSRGFRHWNAKKELRNATLFWWGFETGKFIIRLFLFLQVRKLVSCCKVRIKRVVLYLFKCWFKKIVLSKLCNYTQLTWTPPSPWRKWKPC